MFFSLVVLHCLGPCLQGPPKKKFHISGHLTDPTFSTQPKTFLPFVVEQVTEGALAKKNPNYPTTYPNFLEPETILGAGDLIC